MGTCAGPIPQWSWEDLEAALDRLNGSRLGQPLREHLLRRLQLEAASAPPVDLLTSLLNAAILVSHMPSTATELRREDRSFG